MAKYSSSQWSDFVPTSAADRWIQQSATRFLLSPFRQCYRGVTLIQGLACDMGNYIQTLDLFTEYFHPKNIAPVPRPAFAKPNRLSSRPSRRSINSIPSRRESPHSETENITGTTLPPSPMRRLILGEHVSQSQKYSNRLGFGRSLGSASNRNSLPFRR